MLWGTLKQTWSIAATDGRLPGLGSCCTALIVRLIDRSACGATDGLPLVLSCRADGTRITQAGNTHPSFARKPTVPRAHRAQLVRPNAIASLSPAVRITATRPSPRTSLWVRGANTVFLNRFGRRWALRNKGDEMNSYFATDKTISFGDLTGGRMAKRLPHARPGRRAAAKRPAASRLHHLHPVLCPPTRSI
jgi:hypothetical protein